MGVGFASVLTFLGVDGAARSSTNALCEFVGVCGTFVMVCLLYGYLIRVCGFHHLVAVEVREVRE